MQSMKSSRVCGNPVRLQRLLPGWACGRQALFGKLPAAGATPGSSWVAPSDLEIQRGNVSVKT